MLGINQDYIYESIIQAPIYHLLLEGLLFMWVIWLLKRKKTKPAGEEPLTAEEEKQILDHFNPKPLVHTKNYEPEDEIIDWGTVDGPPGKYIQVNGEKLLNFGTHNYLGFVEEPTLLAETERCIRKYGVGSCGPRGFYGTVDVHLQLEEKIAKFLHLEETALYSYSFAAISSAIPSYAKRGDVIFADEHVNFPIQRGLIASRSDIRFFKHNDLDDLVRLLNEQKKADIKNPVKAKTVRRFCVVEGIYSKTGSLCPLKKISELCLQHKVRLFVDESISFGSIGKTGRGITEYLNVPVEDVDLISGSLEMGLGAFGGFIVGSSYVVDHQRISGLGYCFSASLPPMLAGAGIQAMNLIEENPHYIAELQEKCELFNSEFSSTQFVLSGHPLSPVKHVSLLQSFGSRQLDKLKLREVINHVKTHAKLALVMPAYLESQEKTLLAPSIRITINRLLTREEIISCIKALEKAGEAVLVYPKTSPSFQTTEDNVHSCSDSDEINADDSELSDVEDKVE